MGRYALLIAASEYEDAELADLRAPGQDVDRLAAILEAPEVGGFDSVTVLQDATDYQLRMAIEELLAERQREDLVLVYFSCHGVVDREHRLYFATTNTRRTRPAGTAVSRTFVNEQLEACSAGAKVVILDCCYSGAFLKGIKSAPTTALEGQVGRGYVVLTACDAYEYAWVEDSVTDAAPRASVFTNVLIEGLSSGAADLDGDQQIGVDELFRYVREGVRRQSANQTPLFFAIDAELNICLARADKRSAPLTDTLAREANAAGVSHASRPSTYNRNQVIVARGLRGASDRIRLMLGPLGRRILVQEENGEHVEASDARMLTALYRPEDPRDRLGASYAAQIVEQAHRQSGDGAATAVVLAQAMVEGAAAALRAGAHPMALASGVEAGIARTTELLTALAQDLETREQISAFAAMVARDATAGEIFAEAMDKVGGKGVITIEETNTFGIELELTEGMRLDQGYISPYFVTDQERMECVLEDAYVLIVNFEISANAPLIPVLDKVLESGKPLLLIADIVEGEALATLVVNKIRDIFKSAAVKAPGFGDRRKAILEDVAILTGGQIIFPDQLPETSVDMLGRVRKVIIGKEETTLVDCAGDGDRIVARINQIRAQIENTDSDYDREKLHERLEKLAGGAAVIKVGAAMGTELTELKRRYERVVRACRMIADEGLLPGGCTSLCAVAEAVTATAEGNDRGAGVHIVADALQEPYQQILANAGITGGTPVGRGIDVLSGTPADLFSANILDSTGVLRSALEAASQAVIRFLKLA